MGAISLLRLEQPSASATGLGLMFLRRFAMARMRFPQWRRATEMLFSPQTFHGAKSTIKPASQPLEVRHELREMLQPRTWQPHPEVHRATFHG